jgi:hypothetical protein
MKVNRSKIAKGQIREVTIASGETFKVPQGIQRIDSDTTHGWQVRCHGTRLFSDNVCGGAHKALVLAAADLAERVQQESAPNLFRSRPARHKHSDLPPGISGPVIRKRQGSKFHTASLAVSLPRFGQKPKVTTIYIGSENTYTVERYQAALEKAIALRQAAEAEHIAAHNATRLEAARVAAMQKKRRKAA